MYSRILALAATVTIAFAACKNEQQHTQTQTSDAPVNDEAMLRPISYSFVNSYPHDTTAFTEGLVIHEGKLYESTGSPEDLPSTRSIIGVVDKQTGAIDVKVELDSRRYFGEGIVFLNDKLYQLTYLNKLGFVYDARTFKKIGEFRYANKEGWGLTTDGTHLIMSDGTNEITYLDPNTFNVVKKLYVTSTYGPVKYLNELEYIKGFIYANAFTTNTIVKIDPNTGKIVGKLDLTRLADQAHAKYHGSMEMNGIAYDASDNTVYFTGKMWPYIFQIQIGD